MADRGQTLQQLSREYFDLNGSYIETLDAPPTALEFSRIAYISRPVIIKGFSVAASSRWTNQYLVEKMAERMISIATTPNGQADAVTSGPDGKLYFTEPYIQQMTMKDLLTNMTGERHSSGEIYYLQSQNGNLYSSSFFEDGSDESEFDPLRPDVPSEVPWCSDAFGKHPDAVNLWIGDKRSVTSIHSDPYENIYSVVRGAKHFTLLPPTEGWCLEERTYPHATYARTSSTSAVPLLVTPSSDDKPHVRWSSVSNPRLPDALPPNAHPIHVTLQAGDTLYLPAGWWHFVTQSGDSTIALNWWYDIEIRGMAWVWLSFLRGIEDVPPGNEADVHSTDSLSLVEQ